jgi:perosamine synthetase
MEAIPIYRPWLGQEELEALSRPLQSGWLTQGPEVAAFEQEFAEYVGAERAVAVSSGTAALHLGLLACGVGPGDEVITVSHSFVATVNAVVQTGATPVLVDVEADTFNMDVDLVEQAITERTRALLVVHQLGMPCDLGRLCRLAREKGLLLIEDAACAVGSEIKWDGRWERIGKPHGELACFSFHPRKLLTAAEGGMVVSHSADRLARVERLRNHGRDPEDSRRVLEPGFNYRMSDLHAAVGRVQLGRLSELLVRRRCQVERYRDLLESIPGLEFQKQAAWARSNWQTLALRLSPGADPSVVRSRLQEAGVCVQKGVACSHRQPVREAPWRQAGSLEVGERAEDRSLVIPLFHDMSEADQRRVALALAEALND